MVDRRIAECTLAVALMIALPPFACAREATWLGRGWTQGSVLQEECDHFDDIPTSRGLCYGYIVAIADALAGGNSINGYRAKFPDGVAMPQVIAVVKKYLQEHPEQLHISADSLVTKALHDAFPPDP